MNIVVIQCPACLEFASTDGKYRRECLGRTIGPKHANGYQPYCSACARIVERHKEDEANRRPFMPLWACC